MIKYDKAYYYYHNGDMNNLSSLFYQKLPYWESCSGQYEIKILVDNEIASNQIYEHLTDFDIRYKSIKSDYERGKLWHLVEVYFQTELVRDSFLYSMYESFIKKYRFLLEHDSIYREFQDKIRDRLL